MTALRALAVCTLLTMLFVIAWASSEEALWAIPAQVSTDPWFVATLADAYCGFLIFYAWVVYRERTLLARIGWFIAIMTMGNVASAVYLLRALSKLPGTSGPESILLRPGK